MIETHPDRFAGYTRDLQKRFDYYEVESLLVSQLFPHPLAQRSFSRRRAEIINVNYAGCALREPLVVRNLETGKIYIIDGQHTKVVAEARGLKYLNCRVVDVQNEEEANILFNIVNIGQSSTSPADKNLSNSRSNPLSDDAFMNDYLQVAGLNVVNNGKDDGNVYTIRAVGELQRAMEYVGKDDWHMVCISLAAVADGGMRPKLVAIRTVSRLVKKMAGNLHVGYLGVLPDVLRDEFATQYMRLKEFGLSETEMVKRLVSYFTIAVFRR